jgi:membrane protein
MERLHHLLRALDALQQRHAVLAIPFAVLRKFGQDNASTWALVVAYYGFVAIVPLLLVAVTVTSLVLAHHPGLLHDVTHSVLAQIPVVGHEFASRVRVHALASHSLLGLVVGLIGLLWGAQGVASAAQSAMAAVWNVPLLDRPGFLPRTLRNLGILVVLGANALVTSTMSTIGASLGSGVLVHVLIIVGVALLNCAFTVVGFRLLTPRAVELGDLVLGAVLAGLAWTALQQVGGFLIARDLVHASATYGVFGIVLGLIAWFSLATQTTLLAAELDVVLVRRLWPRSLVAPPLTDADVRALEALALAQRARPEEHIEVRVELDHETVTGQQHNSSEPALRSDETGITATDTP